MYIPRHNVHIAVKYQYIAGNSLISVNRALSEWAAGYN
jgi:hypothetical protein